MLPGLPLRNLPVLALAGAVAFLTAAPATAGEARIYIAPQYVMTHFSGEA